LGGVGGGHTWDACIVRRLPERKRARRANAHGKQMNWRRRLDIRYPGRLMAVGKLAGNAITSCAIR
jgi:hypothetical protein